MPRIKMTTQTPTLAVMTAMAVAAVAALGASEAPVTVASGSEKEVDETRRGAEKGKGKGAKTRLSRVPH